MSFIDSFLGNSAGLGDGPGGGGGTLDIIDGAGNPNGVIVANYGWTYRDTNNDILYTQISKPSGFNWIVK